MKRRGLIVKLIVAAVVVGAAASFVALGGLANEPRRRIDVGPGDEVDAGNLVFRFSSATSQYSKDAYGGPWLVTVEGEVRNPTDTGQSVQQGGPTNLLGWGGGTLPDNPDFSIALGGSDSEYTVNSTRAVVPPDNAWMRLTVQFRFPEDFVPSDVYKIGLPPMEFTNNWLFGLSSVPDWSYADTHLMWVVTIPCTRLPDE